MLSTTENRFALVQDAYELKNWLVAADLLTEILKIPPVAAKHRARQSRGFLADNLPPELARALRDACVVQGIAVRVVPQSDIIPVIKPARVHQVWIADDAMCVQTPASEATTRLGWDTIRLIAVTVTTRRESYQRWPEPCRANPIPRMTKCTEESAEQLADVFAISAPGAVFGARFFSWQVNYAAALGDMAPDALHDANARSDSFRLLLSLIAARATEAYISPESVALLRQASIERVRVSPERSLDEFETYNRWVLQQIGKDGDKNIFQRTNRWS